MNKGDVDYIEGVVFTVSKPDEKPQIRTVNVSGLPEDFVAEKLKVALKTRGGPVERLERNGEVFMVTFENREGKLIA